MLVCEGDGLRLLCHVGERATSASQELPLGKAPNGAGSQARQQRRVPLVFAQGQAVPQLPDIIFVVEALLIQQLCNTLLHMRGEVGAHGL